MFSACHPPAKLVLIVPFLALIACKNGSSTKEKADKTAMTESSPDGSRSYKEQQKPWEESDPFFNPKRDTHRSIDRPSTRSMAKSERSFDRETGTSAKSRKDPSSGRSFKSRRSPELRNTFSQEVQTFEVPENEKITLQCDGGTRIHIPSGSLEKQNGEKIYASYIRVNVKEKLSNAGMLKEDLGTRSGDELLRTKGMLHIQAEADGHPCRIKDGRRIGVSFPNPAWGSGMKLFTGDRGPLGKMNWELEDSAAVKTRKPEFKPVTNDREPRLKGGTMNLKIFLLDRGIYPIEAVQQGIEGKVLTELTITEKGEVEDVEVKESPHPILARAAKRTIGKMPDWSPARFGKKNAELRISLPIRFSLGEKARHRKVFLAEGYEPEKAMERKSREMSYRKYRTSKLGWINCDAFRNDEELVAQKIRLDRKDIGLRLLFKERRSLLRSHRSERNPSVHLFKNVPKGRSVHLIAIGKEDDRFRWASAEMKIGGPVPDLEYEILKKEEMEKRMQALNERPEQPS